jgi:CheY-like chemotaxis protein
MEKQVKPVVNEEDVNNVLNILVVDDNAVNRVIAKKMLQSTGHTVTLACDGREAVDRVKSDPPYDIVLMDCMMPVMDGYDATKVIRGDLSQKDLPIYAVTAAVTDEEQAKCYTSGMDGVLFKPIKKPELSNLFRKISSNGEQRTA